MTVFGGDSDDIKTAAKQQASVGNVTAAIGGLAAMMSPIPPLATGLGLAAAVAAIWSAVQSRIADDPPRDDWDVFPPPPPSRLDLTDEQTEHTPMSGADGLRDWTGALLLHAYSASATLLCAERLAGVRQGGRRFSVGRSGDVQRVLGRYFDDRAALIWRRQLVVRGSGPRSALEVAIASVGQSAEGLLRSTSYGDLRAAAQEQIQGNLEGVRRTFELSDDAWSVVVHGELPVVSEDDVERVREMGAPPLIGAWPSARILEGPRSLSSAFL